MEIENVIRILRKEVDGFEETSVTRVSRSKSPYKVLISCILSLRTKDKVTIKASERLFSLADSPKQMICLKEKEIEQAIYPVAFYRVKSRNIKKVSKIILEKYNSKVPDKIEELLKLPNVGRKTANIVVTQGYGKYGIAVDTHVHRLSNRLSYVRTKSPEETEFALREKLPKKHWIEYNDLLVTWGQNVCVPISPWCSKCAVRSFCRRVGVERSR
jgi:endonuclease-3